MKKGAIVLLACLSSLCLKAQDKNEDFQNYRKGILEGFQGFRKNILDDYAKFLDGIWKDYEVFAGKKANPKPKPEEQPIKKEDEPVPNPTTIEPEIVEPAEPVVEEQTPTPKPIVIPSKKQTPFNWCGMTFELPDAKIKENLYGIEKEHIVEYFNILHNSIINNEVIPQMETITQNANLNDWCKYLLIESYVNTIKADANANTRNFI